MPRVDRREEAGAVHHVVAQGNGRAAIVLDDLDRQRLLIGLARVVRAKGWRVIAYCLMDTHLHLVVLTPAPSLSLGMRQVLGPYARWFNLRHGREGHLFRSPFYSVRLDESHLITASVYVDLNAVRGGICRHPAEYRWGSYRAVAGLERFGLADPGLLLAVLGGDVETAGRRYVRLVDDAVDELRRERSHA